MNVNSKNVGENQGRDGMEPTPHPFRGKGGVVPSRPLLPVQDNYVEKVKELCRGMDVRQRKEVRDYISYLDKEQRQAKITDSRNGQALERDEGMWSDSVEAILAEALGSSTNFRNKSPAILGSLRDSYSIVHEFVQVSALDAAMSYNRKVIYNLLAGLLVEYCKQLAAKIAAPLSLKFVLGQSEKIPALFDRAYPGYVQAGLAGIVLKQIIQSHERS